MSHNQVKVSSKKPSSVGEVTLNVADVSSVSSPSNNDVLTYNGGWVAQPIELLKDHTRALNSINELSSSSNEGDIDITLTETYLPAGQQRFMSWHKETTTFGNLTSFSSNTDDDCELITQNFPNAKIFYKLKFNNAGLYRLFFKFALNIVYSNDADAIDIQWSNGDNSETYGPRVRIKPPNMNQPTCIGIVNASANQEIGLYKHAVIDSPKRPFGEFRDYLMIIEKIG